MTEFDERRIHSAFLGGRTHKIKPFSARQEPRPPKVSPTKVGAHFLRHQLRVKTRSMDVCGFVINWGLKPVA